MRMVVTRDGLIQIDGYGYEDCNISFVADMSWIPGYNRKEWGVFHALQWYDKPEWDDPTDEEMEGYPYGEIEFTNYPPSHKITELGIFEAAVVEWERQKKAEESRIAAEEEERQAEEARLAEEEAKTLDTYLEFDLEDLLTDL